MHVEIVRPVHIESSNVRNKIRTGNGEVSPCGPVLVVESIASRLVDLSAPYVCMMPDIHPALVDKVSHGGYVVNVCVKVADISGGHVRKMLQLTVCSMN